MALVKIEEFNGSITGNAVMETLEIVGVITALNKRQYNFSITGIQKSTPAGLIDDEPDSHIIRAEKIKFIGKRQSFVKGLKVDRESGFYKKAIETMQETDMHFGVTLGLSRQEKRYITADKDGVWYRHSLEFQIEQGDKVDEDYVKCMFETIANMVISSN